MSDKFGVAGKMKSAFSDLFFLSCYCAAVVSLVGAPLIEAGSIRQRADTVQFQGHQVSVATAGDVGRFAPKGPPGATDPVPIPGGLVLPPQIHVFAPGPVNQGFQGVDTEPAVITNYRGFTAIGYPGGFGTATDGNGNSYDVVTDMRVFHGEYVSTDGTHHRGTFVFI